MLISFRDPEFLYEPFPMGVSRGVFDADVYSQLVESFPPKELFAFKPGLGNKYSLSEINNPREYQEYVQSHPIWRQLHAEIKDPGFPRRVLQLLADHKVDLGLLDNESPAASQQRTLRKRLGRVKRAWLGRPEYARPRLNARFEFSMLPADGGNIKPHTDAPGKLITLVLSMVRSGEWTQAFGGGTDMLRPKDITRNFNQTNESLEFDEVEKIHTFEFEPNQCVFFVKTFNSLHAVEPMAGDGSDALRRTLTVNIEQRY